jgi:acetoin utilization deacetylase AcuC-like enzyme
MGLATGYFTQPDHWRQEVGAGRLECPQRFDAIGERLLTCGLDTTLERRDAKSATLADLKPAHSRLHPTAPCGLFDGQREEAKADDPIPARIDSDTSINLHSWDVISLADGAAINATDVAMAGELVNAFCAVRLSRHHVTRNQAMGFCFVNNMAVAAKYALERHGLKRVATIDFDAHQGYDTEDTVSGDERILPCSFCQHSLCPAWAQASAPNLSRIPMLGYAHGMAVHELIDPASLPRLVQHRAEAVVISAGSNDHREADIGPMALDEQDCAWTTERIKDTVQRHMQGRIVDCLAGGCALDAPAHSVQAHLRVLTDV